MARPRQISYVSLYQVCLGTLTVCWQRFLQNIHLAKGHTEAATKTDHTTIIRECFERAWNEAGLHRLQLSMNDPRQQYLLVECLAQVALAIFSDNQSNDLDGELSEKSLNPTWTALALLFAFVTQPMRTLPPEGQPDDWPFCPVPITEAQINSLLDALQQEDNNTGYSLGEHAMATLHKQGAFAVYPEGALPPRLQRILDHGESGVIASEGQVGVLERRLAAIDQCGETVERIKDDISQHCQTIREYGDSNALSQMERREREYIEAVPIVPGHNAHSANPGGRIILPRFATAIRRRLAKFSEG